MLRRGPTVASLVREPRHAEYAECAVAPPKGQFAFLCACSEGLRPYILDIQSPQVPYRATDRLPLSYPLMHIRWFRKRSTRLLVGLVLLPALAIRVLVPPGFMPGTDAGDAPTMQMCHGAGPLPASTQPLPSGDGRAPEQGQHHEAPCVFAAAGSAAPPPIVSVGVVTPQSVDADRSPAELTFFQRSLHRTQAARAPPAGLLHA